MITPKTPPAKTSTGVWPINSLSFLSETFLPAYISSIIRFNILACTPTDRREVWASNIVIKAKITAKAKIGDANPWEKPIHTAKVDTPAACEEGIPPVVINQEKSIFFFLTNPKIIFIDWAITQLVIVAQRTLLLNIFSTPLFLLKNERQVKLYLNPFKKQGKNTRLFGK